MSNTLIARDEGLHQDFAVLLYVDLLKHKLDQSVVHGIVADAVRHEKEFICEALRVSLIGMNGDDMATYIEYVADRLLTQLGYDKLYHSACPFDFMLTQGMETKTSFFEHRVTEYRKAGVLAHDKTFCTDAAF